MLKKVLLLLLAMLLLPQACHITRAAGHPAPRQVVLVICDYLELDDIDQSALPNLYGFFSRRASLYSIPTPPVPISGPTPPPQSAPGGSPWAPLRVSLPGS